MANDLAQTPAMATTRGPASTPSAPGGTGSTQLKAAVRATQGYDAQAALLAPVQQHGGKGDTSGVHAAAVHGLSGSGGALPHGGQIQQAFGGYDISNVTAHTDAAASQGAAAMGADAYATGSSIAFKGAPDLHTAAHEAAHVVQQDAGVSLSGGVGKAGDSYEQHADKVADAVVAGKSAEPILSEMAGGTGGGAVQRKAVQRVETTTPAPTTTPTPHGDAALVQVGAGTTPEAITTPEGEAPAKVYSVPQAYDPYCTHIKTVFEADITELRAKQAKFQKDTQGVAIEVPVMKGNLARQKEFEAKFAGIERELSEEEQKQKRKLAALAPLDGKTMEGLYELAMDTVKKQAELKETGKSNKFAMEGIMLASTMLLAEVDPESGQLGRDLYEKKIDEGENARLVVRAASEDMPPAENATLAVNYRTWARVFVRDEIMLDKTCSEILYMRDLVRSGRESGESPESILKKTFIDMRAELGFGPEDTFDLATEEQKLALYKGMIESAQRTNENVNDVMNPGDNGTPETPKI